jgi:hypothetical protein
MGDIDFRKLLDECQDGVDLAAQMLNLVVGNRDPRQMRDTADGGGVNGHRRSLKPGCDGAGGAFAPRIADRGIDRQLVEKRPKKVPSSPALVPPAARNPLNRSRPRLI